MKLPFIPPQPALTAATKEALEVVLYLAVAVSYCPGFLSRVGLGTLHPNAGELVLGTTPQSKPIDRLMAPMLIVLNKFLEDTLPKSVWYNLPNRVPSESL